MNENETAWPAGIKKTRHRKCIFGVLEQAETPLSASAIFDKARSVDESVWLSTVYRILDYFVSEGLAVKTSVMDSGTALYEMNRSRHSHYAVCVNCHKIIGLMNCPMEKFIPEIAESGFHVLGHRIEMFGYCSDCDKKLSGNH
ncbi:MAG: transcriptional repressor [Oscillospiraceae bacterium]|nr:transcriptional repressor [Oscillospiraceae bacterium]